jgi:TPR repeat protein
MTLEEQRKMVGADSDIEQDCERIAREAAKLVLDRTEDAPPVADLLGENWLEADYLDDDEKQEIDNAIALEREVESQGDPAKMRELADWIDTCTYVDEEEELYSTMLKWYAKAALEGVPAAMSAIGWAFEGGGEAGNVFVPVDEEPADDEDERLIRDAVIGAACELAGAKKGDSLGLLQSYFHYLGWREEAIFKRNFDKGMACLVQLVETNNAVNVGEKGPLQDRWAFQGAHQLELLVKKAPPQSEWDDCEYPYVFGLCHEKGWVLEKDFEKALAYYRMAAGFGHERSKTAAKRVEEELAK